MIVESPAKARTIGQYLGSDYVVESSIGHIRDLPSTASEIPASVKGEAWARLGVNVDEDFQPLYVIPASKKAQVTKLRSLLKDADELYLATDEDREGEAIAWHLREVLKPRIPVHRMVFHEITRAAIEDALAHPREIDERVVDAQEARRILDRLFGYEVSPVLWRKVKPKLSAGRVQSAALRMIVDRERARMRFHAGGYWDVDATLRTRDGREETVLARLNELDGRRVASGRDFDPETGALARPDEVALLDQARAQGVAAALAQATFAVTEVVERPFTQRSPAPFITSTLTQESARKLRYSAQRTMQVAQRLYENGYITYMRTDSTNLSEQAVTAARRQATSLYGAEYIPDKPRVYASGKGAQEAHEAIRPAGDIFRTPESLRSELDDDGQRLYDLIWKRTVASQMRDATGLRTQVRLHADAGEHGRAGFQASGKVITFPGFLRAYVEGSDDPDAELEDQERLLPPLREGQELDAAATEAKGHETQSPSRWTEASLIRELEERGIGRPSTYASIIQTILDRGYVWKKATALVPTFTAFAVINLLEQHFPELVDLDFTARMEESLDEIAEGHVESKPWLRHFYFGDPDAPDDGHLAHQGLKDTIGESWEAIDARAVSSVPLGVDDQGRTVAVRVGRYGAYVQAGDGEHRASLQDDVPPDEVTLESALALLEDEKLGDRVLGADEASGEPIYMKTGRFGPYVQIGEDPPPAKGKAAKDQVKPRRASLWPEMSMETLTVEQARLLLSFPKVLGKHPESDTDVTVQDGPRGPYIKAGTESRSLEGHDHLARVTLEEALALLAKPREGRGGRSSPQVMAELGAHPDRGDQVTIRAGRFGPYVTDGTVNASVPKGRDPSAVTIDEAVDLLARREEKLRSEGKDPRAPKRPTAGRRRTTGGARGRRSA
ncbi:MAG: type I DNA topoisomerase [Chloroflexi bacterium]|nr:type I DNA topoisomerase [Chloroflexota bacterium]MDA1002023.1 type I DNA topoisomerase [Chloroflexota bacterium]